MFFGTEIRCDTRVRCWLPQTWLWHAAQSCTACTATQYRIRLPHQSNRRERAYPKENLSRRACQRTTLSVKRSRSTPSGDHGNSLLRVNALFSEQMRALPWPLFEVELDAQKVARLDLRGIVHDKLIRSKNGPAGSGENGSGGQRKSDSLL